MRAPSFRCTDAEKGKGLILHYYSEREGLQDIVIGIIKTVAQQIHGTEIDMKVNIKIKSLQWLVFHKYVELLYSNFFISFSKVNLFSRYSTMFPLLGTQDYFNNGYLILTSLFYYKFQELIFIYRKLQIAISGTESCVNFV